MSDKKIVQLAKPSPNNDEVIETIKAFQQIAQDISLTSVMLVGLGPGRRLPPRRTSLAAID